MAYNGQWGNTDNASNSVYWGVIAGTAGKVAANSTNQTAFYDNTTKSAYVTNQIVGQFGVDTTEQAVKAGPIVHITVTNPGSGYNTNTANGTFTATNGGASSGTALAANAYGVANSTGRIASVTIANYGNNYITNPTFAIPAPSAVTFNANTAVTGGTGGGANSTIAISSAPYLQAGDLVTYTVASGNTTLSGLTSGSSYYVNFANATIVALSAVNSSAVADRITLTKGLTESGHSLQGQTATAVAVAGGSKGVTHSGWVVRKVGTGGRAGRVTYETLVAMGTMTGDGSDDLILPDA
jgi:hypothetical protein